MTSRIRSVFTAFAVLAISANAAWRIPEAQFRFTVTAESANVAQVLLHPTSAESANLRTRAFNAAGEAIGSLVLRQGKGEPMTVIFDADSEGPYTIYLADREKAGPAPKWLPDGGFLVLSKNLEKAEKMSSPADFLTHWKGAEVSDGSLLREVRNAFPFHVPGNPYQSSFTKPGAPMVLHRHSAVLRVEAPKLERIDGLKKQHSEAVDLLQRLQTRRGEMEAELAELKAEDAGKTRIGIVKRQLDQLTKAELPGAEANAKFLAHAAHEVRENLFEFYTVSKGPAFILINSKLLASSLNSSQGTSVTIARGNRRKEKTKMFGGQIALSPGTHRLDYLYAASGATHDAILSWRPPGVRNADVMASNVGTFVRGTVTAAESKANDLHFSWRIVDDLRIAGAPDLIDVRFMVSNPEEGEYRWDFGDGTQASGTDVRHVYLATGDYQVTLNNSVSHEIFAHPIWNNLRLAELRPYNARFAARDFSKQPIDHIWNAYQFVRAAAPRSQSLAEWRASATRGLTARIDDWQQPQKDAALRIANDAAHHSVADYKGAMAAYGLVVRSTKPGDDDHTRASLTLAQLKLDVDGDPEAALELLTAIRSKQRGPKAHVQAEALLALGRFDEAMEVVPEGESEDHLRGVRHRAAIRRIRSLSVQPGYLDEARYELGKLFHNSPRMILDPQVCILRIDMHLTAGELRQAYHLGNRMQNLLLNEVDKPKVLGKQVEALSAIGLVPEAKAAFTTLEKAYPYATATAVARAALQVAEQEK